MCPHFEAEEDGYYYKIPNSEVVNLIPKIPHRGEKALAALKIYMILLIVRPNQSRVSLINCGELARSGSCAVAFNARRALDTRNSGLNHC